MEILKNSIKLSENEVAEQIFEGEEVKRIPQEKSRWGTHNESIVKIKGKFYSIDWMEAATECQEHEFYSDEFPEVIEAETKIKTWIPKEKQEKINNMQFTAELKITEFKQLKEEKTALIDTCKKMIEMYQEKIFGYEDSINKAEDNLKAELFAMIPHEAFKQTKTQFSYKTPSGQIIRKKQQQSIKLKSEYNEDEIPQEFIKVSRSVKWADFKKTLIINDGKVVNKDTGEIIESCDIELSPEEFKIKIL